MKITIFKYSLLILLAFSFVGIFRISSINLFSKILASSDNFFIDCINGDDSKDGLTQSTAWRNLDMIRNKYLNPGSTIYFKKGCSWDTGYDQNQSNYSLGLYLTSSGTSTAPITYTSYGIGTDPILINSYSEDLVGRVITLDASWNIIENLTIKDAKENGISIHKDASNNIIRNNEITNVGIGIFVYGKHNKILKNTIHDLHIIRNTPKDVNSDDDYGAVGIAIAASHTEVAYNKIYNCLDYSYDYDVDGGAVEFWADDYGGNFVQDVSIHHNYFENNNGGTEFGSANQALFENITFAYNVMVNNRGNILYFHFVGINQFGSYIKNVQFLNNTIYENTLQYSEMFKKSDPFYSLISWSNGNPTTQQLALKNNIIYLENIPEWAIVATDGAFDHSHNLYHITGGAVGYALTPTEIAANPLFMSASLHDFTLMLGSPAIDKGITSLFNRDFSGSAVPQGNAVDMGAYESSYIVSTNPNPIPVPDPNNLTKESLGSVYRFYSKESGKHVLMIDYAEANNIYKNNPAWQYEGIVFKALPYNRTQQQCEVLNSGISINDIQPVYRFFNATESSHFVAMGSEVDIVKQNKAWQIEGVVFCAAKIGTQNQNLTDAFRFYTNQFISHVFTINLIEKSQIEQNSSYIFEGIPFKVFSINIDL